jgi:hypothetical protein
VLCTFGFETFEKEIPDLSAELGFSTLKEWNIKFIVYF